MLVFFLFARTGLRLVCCRFFVFLSVRFLGDDNLKLRPAPHAVANDSRTGLRSFVLLALLVDGIVN